MVGQHQGHQYRHRAHTFPGRHFHRQRGQADAGDVSHRNRETFTSSGFTFSLPAGQLFELEFLGGSTTQFGHAYIPPDGCFDSDCQVYAEVTLRNRNETRPDFESVFSLESPALSQSLFWDHRAGFSTVLYLTYVGPQEATVIVDLLDMENQLIKRLELPIRSATTRIETIHALAPETLGKQGVMVIWGQTPSGTRPLFLASALRINPSNSFTPLPSFPR